MQVEAQIWNGKPILIALKDLETDREEIRCDFLATTEKMRKKRRSFNWRKLAFNGRYRYHRRSILALAYKYHVPEVGRYSTGDLLIQCYAAMSEERIRVSHEIEAIWREIASLK